MGEVAEIVRAFGRLRLCIPMGNMADLQLQR